MIETIEDACLFSNICKVKIRYDKMSYDKRKPYTPPNDHTVFFS